MAPVVEAQEGGDWLCTEKTEKLTEGLGQLDYLFGVSLPSLYDWKVRTFAMRSQCAITQITFTFDIQKHTLRVESHHRFPIN
jgi:hypothetical protein